jgi:hypothetical protein
MIDAKQTLADLIAARNKERGIADDKRTRDILQRAFGDAPMSDFAKRTIELGKIRRGEIPDTRTLPKRGSVAWQILNAARKRDGLEPLK